MDTPERPTGDNRSGVVRRYGEADVRKLRFIRSAQRAGFTLEQIKELIGLDAKGDRSRVLALAQGRIAALSVKIVELEEARSALNALARECAEGSCGPCPILAAFDRGLSRSTPADG